MGGVGEDAEVAAFAEVEAGREVENGRLAVGEVAIGVDAGYEFAEDG